MIIFIYGTDSFRLNQKIKEITDKFISEVDSSKTNLTFLDGENLTENLSGYAIDPSINNKGQIAFYLLNYVDQPDIFLATPNEPTIDAILTFFDDSVADGSLEGDGPGKSAEGRLYALRNMLEMASDLINIDDIEGACLQLNAVIGKCDGYLRPKDFVTGEAVTELYNMILELMEKLECE